MLWGAIEIEDIPSINGALFECSVKGIKLDLNTYIHLFCFCHTGDQKKMNETLFYIHGFMDQDLNALQKEYVTNMVFQKIDVEMTEGKQAET